MEKYMGRLFDSLTKYFETTPQEILEQDWLELKELTKFGPDALSYAEMVEVPYELSTCTQTRFSFLEESKQEFAHDGFNCLAA